MQNDITLLILSTITVACLHTATGPDHYLPFIALSKTRNWSLTQTISWTIICGLGHIGSSVLLGLGGAVLGWSMSKIGVFESFRGNLTGWLMVVFGLIYMIYGLFKAIKDQRHKHFDTYADGSVYVYDHKHGEIVPPQNRYAVTPWVMFIIFVLGPCEPMIPLLYIPAARHSVPNMLLLISVYTLATLLTMVGMVLFGYFGIGFLKTEKLERYVHLLAGFTIFICGLGMLFLDW
jgi:sulfite exporter TauE/SafE